MRSEYFEVYLNSAKSLSGSTTPHICRYNLGSVYDFTPHLQRFSNAPYCYVKVKYFSVEETASNFNSADVGTILIKIDNALPNSLETQSISTSNNKNLQQSNIIGIVPTSIAKNTYSSNTFDNDFIKSPNIFNGDITITLTDQDGANITLTGSKPYVMLLCVMFEDNPDNYNIPNVREYNYF